MLKNYCRVCPARPNNLRIQVTETFALCNPKKSAICHIVDVRLLEILFEDHPEKIFSYSELEAISNQISRNSITLQNTIGRKRFYRPSNPDEFIRLLKNMHEILFRRVSIHEVGIFRMKEVFFDKDHHQREGAKPDEIEYSLRKMWVEILEPFIFKENISRDELLIMGACFMSQFFRIHPFRDGNGRVARNFLVLIFNSLGFDIIFTPREGKSEAQYSRRYMKALRYSHKNFFAKNYLNDYVNMMDLRHMNVYLMQFLNDLVKERIKETDIEIEPDFLNRGTFFNRLNFFKKYF